MRRVCCQSLLTHPHKDDERHRTLRRNHPHFCHHVLSWYLTTVDSVVCARGMVSHHAPIQTSAKSTAFVVPMKRDIGKPQDSLPTHSCLGADIVVFGADIVVFCTNGLTTESTRGLFPTHWQRMNETIPHELVAMQVMRGGLPGAARHQSEPVVHSGP
ncbi:hypothetical protein MPLA_670045 [Mesorhizobium sp. ORS 3359]|nr:hypothetical protein MPLA_670045 [Mesorhizobium sp. ORS 3359]